MFELDTLKHFLFTCFLAALGSAVGLLMGYGVAFLITIGMSEPVLYGLLILLMVTLLAKAIA